MIRTVEMQTATWNDLPWKFEAGTPNVEGAVGLGAAVDYLNRVGMDSLRKWEGKLTKYAFDQLSEVEGLRIYGPGKAGIEERVGVITFSLKGIHAHDVATLQDREGIAIRAGHHCAMPLVKHVLKETALARMSFYLYNTEEEIDRAVAAIKKTKKVFHR